MKDNIQIGLVGLGGRGYGVLEAELMRMTDITITGVCDLYEDRVKKAADLIEKKTGVRPLETTDYRKCLELPIDAVIITAAWKPIFRRHSGDGSGHLCGYRSGRRL